MLVVLGVFVGLSGYGFLHERGTSRLQVEADKLTVSRVERGPFQEFIPVRGTVLPLQTVYLDAMEGGRVEQVLVEEGAMVQQGEAILKLANSELQLYLLNQEADANKQREQVRTARLGLEQQLLRGRQQVLEMEYQLAVQRRNYERYSSLSEQNRLAMMARQDYEKLKDEYEYGLRRHALTIETQRQDSLLGEAQVRQIEEGVGQQQQNLALVRQRLEHLVLRAPVAGQLTALKAEVGESKGQGERLGQIDVLEGYKVRAGIDEFYINRIQKGQPGAFEQGEAEYRLVIKKVYPEVRDGRFEVDLEFAGTPPEGIRRGQTLQLRLELGDLEEAVLLARGGFYQKTGGNWVYVLDPAGSQAARRNIRLGRHNPQVFEVLDGLAPGEQVITSSYDNFGDMDVLVLH